MSRRPLPRSDVTKNKSERRSQLAELLESDYRMCGALAVTTSSGPGQAQAARLRCKRWGCPVCGPWLQRRLREGIVSAIAAHDLDYFITLTMNRGRDSELPEVWGRFLDRIKAAHGRRLRFVWVLDLHESGQLHLHAVVDLEIDRAVGAAAWKSAGGGSNLRRNLHTRAVEDARADAIYMTKGVLAVPQKRRYQPSKGIRLQVRGERSGSSGWKLSIVPFKALHKANRDRIIWEKRGLHGLVDAFGMELDETDGASPTDASEQIAGKRLRTAAGQPDPGPLVPPVPWIVENPSKT